MKTISKVGAFSLALVLALSSPSAAIQYQTVIVSGRPNGDPLGPELGPGIDWDDASVEDFVLNNAGQILLINDLDDFQPNNTDRAAWRWTNGSKELLIREGSIVGGDPGIISNLFETGINLADDGTALFSPRVESGWPLVAFDTNGTELIVTRDNNPVQDPPFAARSPEGEFEYLDFFYPSLFDDGTFMESAVVQGPGISTSNDSVLWYGTIDNYNVIARDGDPAPGFPAGTVFDAERVGFVSHRHSGGYQVFGARVRNEDSSTERALFVHTQGEISLLANNASPTGTPMNFSLFHDIQVNSAGDVGLVSRMQGTTGQYDASAPRCPFGVRQAGETVD